MSNPVQHSPAYRWRRFQNWFPLGLTYATFYMGRYNLNVSSKTMMDYFHLTKGEFGTIATAGFWTYAVSVIFNGPLADRIGGRKAILIGALGAGTLNLAVGLMFFNGWTAHVLWNMSWLWSLNMYFQSFGALSVVKVNSTWFHVHERGIFGGIFGIMISSGYFLATTIGSVLLATFANWNVIWFVPAAATLISTPASAPTPTMPRTSRCR
jgi:OPA family glycerol-3-phosphate transporter-like MFS transporter